VRIRSVLPERQGQRRTARQSGLRRQKSKAWAERGKPGNERPEGGKYSGRPLSDAARDRAILQVDSRSLIRDREDFFRLLWREAVSICRRSTLIRSDGIGAEIEVANLEHVSPARNR